MKTFKIYKVNSDNGTIYVYFYDENVEQKTYTIYDTENKNFVLKLKSEKVTINESSTKFLNLNVLKFKYNNTKLKVFNIKPSNDVTGEEYPYAFFKVYPPLPPVNGVETFIDYKENVYAKINLDERVRDLILNKNTPIVLYMDIYKDIMLVKNIKHIFFKHNIDSPILIGNYKNFSKFKIKAYLSTEQKTERSIS